MSQPFAEEGFALMGAAFEVHNIQGGGLLEEIYQQSLEIALELRSIPFRSKQELDVFYKDRVLAKKYVPDLFVYDKIVVELKAVSSLTPEHEGTTDELHADHPQPDRLSDQLRAYRKTCVQTFYPFGVFVGGGDQNR